MVSIIGMPPESGELLEDCVGDSKLLVELVGAFAVVTVVGTLPLGCLVSGGSSATEGLLGELIERTRLLRFVGPELKGRELGPVGASAGIEGYEG